MTDATHPHITTLQDRAEQFHQGLISSRELLGHVLHTVGTAWESGSDTHETEEIAKLANWAAHLFKPQSQSK